MAIPADHPLGANDRLSASRLAGLPLIVVGGHQNAAYTALLSEALAGIAFQGPSTMRSNDTSSALKLVAHGFGIAFLPQYSAAPRTDVTYVPLDLPVSLRFAAIWSKLNGTPVLRRRFLDALIDVTAASRETLQVNRPFSTVHGAA